MSLAPLRIVEDPASFRVSSSAVFKSHLPSTLIISLQHSTSIPYLYYSEGKEYTGLDSRIISTRLSGLEKLDASILKAVQKGLNIEEKTLALQTKRYRSLYFYKKLLKIYHKEMGDAPAMPLPDEDDKNYMAKQHYTGLDKTSQINHIQDGEAITQHRMEGREGYTKATLQANIRAESTEKILSIIHNSSHNMPSFTETPSTTANAAPNTTTVETSNQSTETVQKTEAQLEADRLYEERIEEEYAKREGGA
ncbi:hypothetical protein BTUL_0108g00250 [Botrytis tulipae]|uniref:Uncharacterized protein n=1 Tax=Botrytis tulipae TaxID=87230 RepID=A0A4Z1ELI0_9HELO|nr:hypothetical protein BTUL_0108g00250 [Botrytis tulipae]